MGRTFSSMIIIVALVVGCGTEEASPTSPSTDLGADNGGQMASDSGSPPTGSDSGAVADAGDLDMAGTAAGGEMAGDMGRPIPADGGPEVPDEGVEPGDGGVEEPSVFTGMDEDDDGLDDGWETWAGQPDQLSAASADTDGDGVGDGDEDHDGDGLTNLEEQSAGAYPIRVPDDSGPHPFRADVLIELDAMNERALDVEQLEEVSAVFGAVQRAFFEGHPGVGVYFYLDEEEIPVQNFDGAFDPRQDLLESHGPTFDEEANLPTEEMIHMVVATRRTDLPGRAGEVLTHPENLRRSGIIIYADALADLFPMCGLDDPPPIPHVSYDEAMVGTIAHELGHVLQLGHDTEANGGINHFNVMSVPERCPDIRRHFLGEGNMDPARGATEGEGMSRLSAEAAALIRLDSKLGVDTSRLLDNDNGFEM